MKKDNSTIELVQELAASFIAQSEIRFASSKVSFKEQSNLMVMVACQLVRFYTQEYICNEAQLETFCKNLNDGIRQAFMEANNS